MQMHLELGKAFVMGYNHAKKSNRRRLVQHLTGWEPLILPLRVLLISKPNRHHVISFARAHQVIAATLPSAAMIVAKHLSRQLLSRAKTTLSTPITSGRFFSSSNKDS